MRQGLKQRLATVFKALATMSAHPAFADRPAAFMPLAGPLSGVMAAQTISRIDAARVSAGDPACAVGLRHLQAEIAACRVRRAPAHDHLISPDETREIAALVSLQLEKARAAATRGAWAEV